MPQATVLTHKNGMVHIEFPYNPAALSYDFYTAEIGGGDPNHMAIAQANVPNPVPPGANQIFDFTDAQLGIKDGSRGWGIRITENVAGVKSSLFSEPTVNIPASDPYKPLYQKKVSTDTAKDLSISFTRPIGKFVFKSLAYKKSAAGVLNFVFKKQYAGAAPVEILRQDGFSASDLFFALDIDFAESESLIVVTEGAALVGAEYHEVTVNWA